MIEISQTNLKLAVKKNNYKIKNYNHLKKNNKTSAQFKIKLVIKNYKFNKVIKKNKFNKEVIKTK